MCRYYNPIDKLQLFLPLLRKCSNIFIAEKRKLITFVLKHKGKMNNLLDLVSVEQYNRLFGLDTLHPLISVIDLNTATKRADYTRWQYGIYAVYLKMEKQCDIMYGRTPYDYQEGTIVCFAPGQSTEISLKNNKTRQNVLGVLFHPDFLKGTSLNRTIGRYSFFSYKVNEALHLSAEERDTVIDCMRIMQKELKYGTDKHSKTLLANNLELLLNYCMRFYERQFATRTNASNGIMDKFDNILNAYFDGHAAEANGLPSVKYFADKLCLSSNYFGDLLKKMTGKSPKEYIKDKVIETAKEKMSATEESISQIAYSLGFNYPQHFCRMFKEHEGCTPGQYRTNLRSGVGCAAN